MKALKVLSLILTGAICIQTVGGVVPAGRAEAAEASSVTFPAVYSYTAGSGEFSLGNDARIYVAGNSKTLNNEALQDDLELMSSEFAAKGLTEGSMDIVYGAADGFKAGDIVVSMEDIEETDNAEGYKIEVGSSAKVTAPNEDGIFYGMRTIQKALLANDGQMEQGTIVDQPAVGERSFHLDAARKEFTKDWILALIKDLSYQNYNSLQFHFSENEGFRLECETLEREIPGFRYSSGYFTKEDMLEIISVCDQYHIELIPSMDSPGHMQHVLDQLPADYRCTTLFPSDDRRAQTFNIFQKEEARQLLKDMFTEYAEFFSQAGCKHMNIGGDEFLAQFSSMTNDQYLQVIDYFNEIAKIVEDHGMTPRAWSDGLMFGDFTGYKLDPKIEICYWSGPASCASVKKFTDNGNKVLNYSDAYMYYVLAWWWDNYANPEAEKIYKEWHPGKLPSLSGQEQGYSYPYTDPSLLGASFALWCDTPSYKTPEKISEDIFLRTRATAQKCWNPAAQMTYEQLAAAADKLQHVAGYSSELPEPGKVSYSGAVGSLTIRYQDEKGNVIRPEEHSYGIAGEDYRIVPPQIYGYQFVSMDKDESGKYTEEDIVATLTYKMVTDKEALQQEVAQALKEEAYIPQTFAAYQAALDAAREVLADEDAGQAEIDGALAALRTAAQKVVSLEKLEIYLEVMSPAPSASYTEQSYAAYAGALQEAEAILYSQDAKKEDVARVSEAVRTAKAGLQGSGGIRVSSDMSIYTADDGTVYPLTNMLDGDRSSFAWTNVAQTEGAQITFTFPRMVELSKVQIQAPEDAGNDHLYGADVEVSADGKAWEKAGSVGQELDTTVTLEAPEQVQYVRVTITKAANYWLKIAEVRFGYTETAAVDKTELTEAIERALAQELSSYTEESVSKLVDVLLAAMQMVNAGVAGGDEINEKAQQLQAAIDGLEDREVQFPFTDVPEGWDTDVKGMISYLNKKGIMKGYSDHPDTFGFYEPITRGQAATVLYRMYCVETDQEEKTVEKNGPLAEKPFSDVNANLFYSYAIEWAADNEIVTGYTATGKFGPDDLVNREQLVTMLYRYAKFRDEKLVEGIDDKALDEYPDKDQVQPYENNSGITAMKWAVTVGMIQGTNGNLAPLASTIRGQAAIMFYRYLHRDEWKTGKAQ